MYVFEYMLPFFPTEYRRRISCEIMNSYHTLQDGEYDTSDVQFVTIQHWYLSLQRCDMWDLERLGQTNTNGNPFYCI